MPDELSLYGSSSDLSGFSEVEELEDVQIRHTSASDKAAKRPLGSKQRV